MASALRQVLLILMLFLIQFNNTYTYCGLRSYDRAQSVGGYRRLERMKPQIP